MGSNEQQSNEDQFLQLIFSWIGNLQGKLKEKQHFFVFFNLEENGFYRPQLDRNSETHCHLTMPLRVHSGNKCIRFWSLFCGVRELVLNTGCFCSNQGWHSKRPWSRSRDSLSVLASAFETNSFCFKYLEEVWSVEQLHRQAGVLLLVLSWQLNSKCLLLFLPVSDLQMASQHQTASWYFDPRNSNSYNFWGQTTNQTLYSTILKWNNSNTKIVFSKH